MNIKIQIATLALAAVAAASYEEVNPAHGGAPAAPAAPAAPGAYVPEVPHPYPVNGAAPEETPCETTPAGEYSGNGAPSIIYPEN
ncbi:hypothetical protein IWQ56_006839, partial [Coemansia nantahalensis]